MTRFPYKPERAKNFFLSISPFLILALLVAFKPLFVRPVFKAVPSGKSAATAPNAFQAGGGQGRAASGDSLLMPISIVDEAFKGFNIPKSVHNVIGQPVNNQGPGAKDGPPEKEVLPTPLPKPVPAAVSVSRETARVPGVSVPLRRSDKVRDDDLKRVEDLVLRAKLSETEKREILRSYEDLGRIMPKQEALKIIRMRLEKAGG